MLAFALMMALVASSGSGGTFADLAESACANVIAVPVDAPARVEVPALVVDGALVGSDDTPPRAYLDALALSSEPMLTVSGVAGDDRLNGETLADGVAIALVNAPAGDLAAEGDVAAAVGCTKGYIPEEVPVGGDEDFVEEDEWAGYNEWAGYDEWIEEEYTDPVDGSEAPAEDQTGGEEIVDGGAEEGGA